MNPQTIEQANNTDDEEEYSEVYSSKEIVDAFRVPRRASVQMKKALSSFIRMKI